MTLIKKIVVLMCFMVCFGCHNQGGDTLMFTIPRDYKGLVIIGFDNRFQSDSCQIDESGILLRNEHSHQNSDITIGYRDDMGNFVQICDKSDLANGEICASDKFVVSEVSSSFSLNLCYYRNVGASNNSDTCFFNIENLKYLVISSNEDSVLGENLLVEADSLLTKFIITNFK